MATYIYFVGILREMSRVLALVAGLLLTLVPASAAADQASAGKARLQIVSGSSLVLRGTQFVPGERVKISLLGDLNRSKWAAADGRGTFVVRFRMSFDRCNSNLRIMARGDRGSRAGAKMPQLMCPPRL